MIGRLLQSAANTLTTSREGSTRGTPTQLASAKQLESNIEEAHTRDLLYPDIEALKTTQHSALSSIDGRVPATPAEANSFDDRGGLDIVFPHDVRVIIAQDANARHQAQILYDSKPKRANTPPLQEQGPAANQRLHQRGKSMSSPHPGRQGNRSSVSYFANNEAATPASPLSPTRTRNPFASGHSAFEPASTEADGSHARHARESKEEIEGLLTCVFGAPGHRIEPGTKLHILSKDSSDVERPKPRIVSRGFAGRRSNLARSSSGFDVPRERGSSAPPAATSGRTSVMITRLFNVQLPESTITDDEDGPAPPTSYVKDSDGKEVEGSPAKSSTHAHRVKQKKTPAYAIAFIIHLPTESFTRTRSNPMAGVISLPSSYQSSGPNSPRFPLQQPLLGWMDTRVQGSLGADSALSAQISYILGNWTLLSRNLRLLESTAKLRLRQLLESVVPLVPNPVRTQGKAGNVKIRRPKLPSQQAVFVNGDCLQDDIQIRKQTRDCLRNVANGLRTRRVTPGQSRWGAWREEARSISRWAGTKDQNFFFFVFMTAFLGQHTTWLEQIAPRWYRQRAEKQRRFGHDDHESLPHRTVLVCKNKMDARRLIFLAASFLPTSFKNSFPALAPPRLGFSESPPSLPTPREPRKSTSARVGVESSGHGRSVSFSVGRPSEEATDDERHAFGVDLGRRASEAGSVRSAFAPLNTPHESRKTSTSTFLADSQLSAQPVAHFSNVSIDVARDAQVSDRPGSSASMASVALNQALKRGESAGAGFIGNRFGHMMTGLWSTAADTESGPGNESAIASADQTPQNRRLQLNRGQSTSGIKPSLKSPNKLSRMVEEADQLNNVSSFGRSVPTPTPFGRSPDGRGPLDLDSCLKKTPTGLGADDKSSARVIPRRTEPDRVPLQLSRNEAEGFVDVSMPPGHSLTTSLASSFASLRMSSAGYPSAYSSMTGLWAGSGAGALTVGHKDESEHFSPYGSPSFAGSSSPRPEKTPEVAGWLKSFHPDFLLQAVQPYDSLDADVRAALEAEARLSHPNDEDAEAEESEEWRNLASILVADTSRFAVERLTLQRRKRRTRDKPVRRAPAQEIGSKIKDGSSPLFASPVSSAASLTSMHTEEQIVSEPLMDVDPVLIDAFERVLAQVPNQDLRTHSRAHSTVHSRMPSRAQSPIRSRPVSVRSSNPSQHPQSTSGFKQKPPPDAAAPSSADSKLQDSGKFTVPRPAGKESAYKQVPFAECRNIILGALADVVKVVIEDRDLSERNTTGAEAAGKTASGAVLGGHSVDGTLREGVSRWLTKIEEGARHW